MTDSVKDCHNEYEFFQHTVAILGNGNFLRGMILLEAIASRLAAARRKHPVFAEGAPQALGVIGSEYDELCYAVEKESPQRQTDEALDVLVTAFRFVATEHLGREI